MVFNHVWRFQASDGGGLRLWGGRKGEEAEDGVRENNDFEKLGIKASISQHKSSERGVFDCRPRKHS